MKKKPFIVITFSLIVGVVLGFLRKDLDSTINQQQAPIITTSKYEILIPPQIKLKDQSSPTSTNANIKPNYFDKSTFPKGADVRILPPTAAIFPLPGEFEKSNLNENTRQIELPVNSVLKDYNTDGELPADLKSQLTAEPIDLPEDMLKLQKILPRIISIDEVNNPENSSQPRMEPVEVK